jgi:fimbrial chaperone protein
MTNTYRMKDLTMKSMLAALAVLVSLPALAGTKPAGPVNYPGFGLSASRVVVMEGDAGSGQVVAMNNSDNIYLAQSRVWPADGVTGYPLTREGDKKTAVPFLVTPPLKRLDSWSTLQLRIMVMPDNHLPADRESLFFLSSRAIPSEPAPVKGVRDDETKARVSMALQNFIKLYYRPKGLGAHAIFDGAVAGKVRMSRGPDNRLRVTNPTPYYLTFGVLTVNGRALDADARRVMVPPLGTQEYVMPAGAGVKGAAVKWRLIDEFGLVTDEQQQTLP